MGGRLGNKHRTQGPTTSRAAKPVFRYDVFISYSHRNRRWVQETLVPALRKARLKVCVDDDDFTPGAALVTEVERAVLESRRTILVFTPHYLKSEWTEFENLLLQPLDLAGRRRRLLPILLARCDVPPRLSIPVRLDFTTPRQRDQNLPRLIAAIRKQAAPAPVSAVFDAPDAKRFRQYLSERYRYLDFRGMGISDRVPLRLELARMFVPLQARVEMPEGETWSHELRLAGRKAAAEEMESMGRRVSTPQPVTQLLREHAGLIVLGDPGAGKTTLLKYLAVECAAGRGKAFGLDARLPLLVPISGYANALQENDIALADYLPRFYSDHGITAGMAAVLDRALADGRALVLLDGLDEVSQMAQRRLVVDHLTDFIHLHRDAGNKFIVTSRIVGYREVRPVIEGVLECTLADFDDAEIEAFVGKWTTAVEHAARGDSAFALEEARRQHDDLLRAMHTSPGVRGLASNPLLLTILALMLRQGVSLPNRRVELYQRYVDTLLRTWNLARGLGRSSGRELDVVETMKVLAPLALWMHQTSPGVGLVKREPVRRKLQELYESRGSADPERAAEQFLVDVREHAGLLVLRGPESLGFLHLTFQEYLAAVAIGQQGQKGTAPVVAALSEHIDEPTWREVILLTIGYLGIVQQREEAAGDVVEDVIARATGEAGVAAAVMGEAVADALPGGVSPDTRDRVVRELRDKLTDDAAVPARTRAAVGNVLARLGDSRFRADAWFLPRDPMLGFIEVPAGSFWMGSDRRSELPQHQVSLPGSFIARWPVTVAQFRAFVDDRGETKEDAYALGGVANHPVAMVTWHRAVEYCAWLTEKLRAWLETPDALAYVLRGGGASQCHVTLPSEAEWEKAARGTDRRVYPWGDQWDANRANCFETGVGTTSALGCFPEGRGPWGAEELSGNVWEWTRSLWGKDWEPPIWRYPYQLNDGRENLQAGDEVRRVVRGGCWSFNQEDARVASRFFIAPDSRSGIIGLRVCVSPIR